ncbi:MAG: hypothetical protein K2V38_11335, partial [Gemmataceae bacterium]|nr:hypothetical protein [Gemmataceae bacterium]
HGPANVNHFVIHLLYILPLVGLGLLWHMYRHRGLYVLVYPTGLLRLRRGEVDSFPWAEVEHVTLKIQRSPGPEFRYHPDGGPRACWLPVEVPTFKLWDAGLTLVRADGAEAHFGPALTDYDRLAEQVQRRTFAALWPRALARFRDGHPLAFGELELDLTGLRYNGKHLRWRDLKEIAVAQGRLGVKQAGAWLPWALLDVAAVPNLHVLFALVEEGRRARPPKEEPKPTWADQPE